MDQTNREQPAWGCKGLDGEVRVEVASRVAGTRKNWQKIDATSLKELAESLVWVNWNIKSIPAPVVQADFALAA